MKLLDEHHNWTEDGKKVAIQFEEALKPVFLDLLGKGCDWTEIYSIGANSLFNVWMAVKRDQG